MEASKKKRGENWSSEEKQILRELIAQSAHILENKSTKTNINLLKIKEWKNVANKHNEINGKCRSDAEVKLAWKRMKLAAKANLSQQRKEQNRTGGGSKPPSPSREDLEVMSIAPHDFIVETNSYDSDAVIPKQSVVETTAGPSSEEPLIVIIAEEEPDNFHNQEVADYQVAGVKDKEVIKKPKKSSQKKESTGQNRNERDREAIVNSNIDFKKRHLEMLEEEHKLNLQISKLKIKKLMLEVTLLQTQINPNLNESQINIEE